MRIIYLIFLASYTFVFGTLWTIPSLLLVMAYVSLVEVIKDDLSTYPEGNYRNLQIRIWQSTKWVQVTTVIYKLSMVITIGYLVYLHIVPHFGFAI